MSSIGVSLRFICTVCHFLYQTLYTVLYTSIYAVYTINYNGPDLRQNHGWRWAENEYLVALQFVSSLLVHPYTSRVHLHLHLSHPTRLQRCRAPPPVRRVDEDPGSGQTASLTSTSASRRRRPNGDPSTPLRCLRLLGTNVPAPSRPHRYLGITLLRSLFQVP